MTTAEETEISVFRLIRCVWQESITYWNNDKLTYTQPMSRFWCRCQSPKSTLHLFTLHTVRLYYIPLAITVISNLTGNRRLWFGARPPTKFRFSNIWRPPSNTHAKNACPPKEYMIKIWIGHHHLLRPFYFQRLITNQGFMFICLYIIWLYHCNVLAVDTRYR